ncbi:hypothetical protein DH2020_034144 [Rehmannia glutinosa]|uniref:F-box protein n=1 Tax=Rehmannia glutinosa TaxID=99300 RepID=A0ABR0VDG5_REHGL
MTSKIKIPRKTKLATSAEVVNSIDDLLMQIFLCLPVKSLMCFKLVSKRWKSLITSPDFRLLRNPDPSAAVGLFYPVRKRCEFEYIHFDFKAPINPPFRKLNFQKEPYPFWIHHSCNGLLLCCSTGNFDLVCSCYVYNPTTKCSTKLPLPGVMNGVPENVYGVNLAFDPAKSPLYKVVCVRDSSLQLADSQFLIGIYSSETRTWRLCGDPFAAMVNFDKGVYWNGAIHWLGIGEGESLYFNIDNQVLDKMPMLPIRYHRNSRSDYFFGQSCGHLHFIETPCSTIRFDVYEMKRDYSEWFVKYQVNLTPVVAANREMIWGHINPMGWYNLVFSVFTVVRGEHEEDSFLVLQSPKKIIRYNLVRKTFESLSKFEDEVVRASLRYPGTSGFEYIKSLCCV